MFGSLGLPVESSDDEAEIEKGLSKRERRRKEREDPDEAPAFLLLESCWNKIGRARTQSKKLRFEKSILPKPRPGLVTEERLEYSANLNHDYDGEITMKGEYNNDSFFFKDVSMESTIKDEAKATAIFEDFKNDVDRWKLKFPPGTSTSDERNRYASYLSEHFLASRLDPLAGTTEVRRIRREIAKRIQLIENYGDDTVKSASPKKHENGSDDNEPASIMDSEQALVLAKPWRCKICTKRNDPKILKCIVCGREKTADALKTRAFISAVPKNSVADRKGQAVMSALSSAADVGSIYSERKYIRKLRHNEKKVHDSTQKTGKNGKRPPATWGGRHSESLTSLPQHAVKSAGIGRPIGHL